MCVCACVCVCLCLVCDSHSIFLIQFHFLIKFQFANGLSCCCQLELQQQQQQQQYTLIYYAVPLLLLPAPVLYPFVRLIAHASYREKKQSARPLFQVSFCYLNCTTVLFFLLTSFFCMARFVSLLCFALHLPLSFVTF